MSMIIFSIAILGVSAVIFGAFWVGQALRRRTTRRWPFVVGAGLLFAVAVGSLVVPESVDAPFPLIATVATLCLIAALVFLSMVFKGGPKPSAADGWAGAHGVTVNTRNSDFVVAYVFEGHRLRLVCGIGGFVAAAALSAGTGIDLKTSGWVWLLSGYLLGVVWSEGWLTRLPAGTQRMASLAPRRVSDYLSMGMLRAQLVVVLVAVAFAGLALAQGSDPHLVDGFATQFGDASARSLRHTIIGMAIAAMLLAIGVGSLQRHIVGKSQPTADPDLLAADDAVRASAVHLLSGTAIAIVVLLVGTQLGMLAAIGVVADGTATMGYALCFVGAFVAWRFLGHRSWVVRRPEPSSTRTGALEGSWS